MRPHPASEASERARIEAAAADWLVRRGESTLAEGDGAAFYAWLEADPRHGEAYDELARALEDVGQIPGLARLPRRARPAWVWVRRGVPILAAACVLIVAAVAILPRLQGAPQTIVTTKVAEIRRVTLDDGSVVTVGAHSEIIVHFSRGERHVALDSGEAFFEIAHDAERPFIVEAGGTRVRAIGTKFDVHRGVGKVRVAVQEGRVEVRETRAVTLSPAVRELAAGQRTEVQERPTYLAISAPPPAAEPITAARPGAWREGRLAYDNARLVDVVADINRYYVPGATLSDVAVGDLHVTASFRVDQISSFLAALQDTLPVSVTDLGGGQFSLGMKPQPS